MSRHIPKNRGGLTYERLIAVLSYNSETGVFRRKERTSNSVRDGDVAGWIKENGYRRISIDNRKYFAHHLAWMYVHKTWPAMSIDHIDGARDNNAIGNLRLATTSQNHANKRSSGRNSSGLKGVCWDKNRRKWFAQIMVKKKTLNLGRFATKEEAFAAYSNAAKQYYGEFARVK